jgi:two-component system, OmpR family, response regulator
VPRPKRILVVEDDPDIRGMVVKVLERAGFQTFPADSAEAARAVVDRDAPDLIVLDLLMPGESGLDFARRLRATHQTPIIMLTALGEVADRLRGFALGADDYLPKPFSAQELVARVEAVLKRSQGQGTDDAHKIYRFCGWTVDTRGRTLHDPRGTEIILTSAEFDILVLLCRNAGQTLSRDRIVHLTQGRRVEPYDRSVDTLISRIRQKIEADPAEPALIKTIRNGGYVLTPTVDMEGTG